MHFITSKRKASRTVRIKIAAAIINNHRWICKCSTAFMFHIHFTQRIIKCPDLICNFKSGLFIQSSIFRFLQSLKKSILTHFINSLITIRIIARPAVTTKRPARPIITPNKISRNFIVIIAFI
ncbi:hypothetical protein H1N96_gp12 [Escherichia phage PGN590]|uniref:Uncharacterized protein n=1 Tax=Escherichia phage PGN590 TaxID=2714735 RepID=A0A6M9E883_9CAUD|nr:hypothetical protein H1N96_gp12 [Escherichia phage PGN590]QKL16935.1 hypothetical protein [Escherichia phage PGN590]